MQARRVFFVFFVLLLFFVSSLEAASWEAAGLIKAPSNHWVLSEEPSPGRPGNYYLESNVIAKLNGFLSSVPLYPASHGISPQEEIHARMNRFIAAQGKDFNGVRSYLTYGDAPAEQLIYILKDKGTQKVLAWFVITHWAYNGRLYSLSLSSLTDSPYHEVDDFFIDQLGAKRILKEDFLP